MEVLAVGGGEGGRCSDQGEVFGEKWWISQRRRKNFRHGSQSSLVKREENDGWKKEQERSS
ncbi:uncharacterized protein G2W53_001448 [Senna tora]|uniref:Uncharacterized protein n=1 Tax=Senna tora TaxID=362788 RepID=A0A834XJQ4_9FABA|nr:uncharacterized protein G2W53_001448 [Senna tora]